MGLNTLEKDFWAMLKRGTKKVVDWQRIESPLTGRGIPDLDGCAFGIQAWVELKVIKGSKVDLRPDQVVWLTRRGKVKGGNCWILAYDDREDTDTTYLWHGRSAQQVRAEGTACPPVGMWERENKSQSIPWGQIIKIMFAQ